MDAQRHSDQDRPKTRCLVAGKRRYGGGFRLPWFSMCVMNWEVVLSANGKVEQDYAIDHGPLSKNTVFND